MDRWRQGERKQRRKKKWAQLVQTLVHRRWTRGKILKKESEKWEKRVEQGEPLSQGRGRAKERGEWNKMREQHMAQLEKCTRERTRPFFFFSSLTLCLSPTCPGFGGLMNEPEKGDWGIVWDHILWMRNYFFASSLRSKTFGSSSTVIWLRRKFGGNGRRTLDTQNLHSQPELGVTPLLNQMLLERLPYVKKLNMKRNAYSLPLITLLIPSSSSSSLKKTARHTNTL